MDINQREEELQDAFTAFAAEDPRRALVLITGLFVGLLEYNIKENGGDNNKEIKIVGHGMRDITVHAAPEP